MMLPICSFSFVRLLSVRVAAALQVAVYGSMGVPYVSYLVRNFFRDIYGCDGSLLVMSWRPQRLS